METYIEAHKKVFIEVISNSDEVRAEYLANFSEAVSRFSLVMSQALTTWHQFDFGGAEHAAERACVTSLSYSAIMLHIQSMKLFLSGCPVAAGNLSRQVVETLSLAVLCSAKGVLPVVQQFLAEQYPVGDALRDIRLHQEALGLSTEALECLEKCQRFYHLYSHPTKMTVASYMSYSDAGLYIGASFDEGKLAFYEKEIERRAQLAEIFPELLQQIRKRLRAW